RRTRRRDRHRGTRPDRGDRARPRGGAPPRRARRVDGGGGEGAGDRRLQRGRPARRPEHRAARGLPRSRPGDRVVRGAAARRPWPGTGTGPRHPCRASAGARSGAVPAGRARGGRRPPPLRGGRADLHRRRPRRRGLPPPRRRGHLGARDRRHPPPPLHPHPRLLLRRVRLRRRFRPSGQRPRRDGRRMPRPHPRRLRGDRRADPRPAGGAASQPPRRLLRDHRPDDPRGGFAPRRPLTGGLQRPLQADSPALAAGTYVRFSSPVGRVCILVQISLPDGTGPVFRSVGEDLVTSSAEVQSDGGGQRPDSLYRKLKPRPGHSGQRVAEHQRSRIHAATIELVNERGYDGLTVIGIARAAGISNRTFYENFKGKEDCFLATYELIVRHTAREVLAARHRERGWRAKLRAGFLAFAREVADNPKAARLALVEAFTTGASSARMGHTNGLFETLVADSLARDDSPVDLPPLIVKGIVAGATRIARVRLLAGEEQHLSGDADELLDWALSLHSPAAGEVCTGSVEIL